MKTFLAAIILSTTTAYAQAPPVPRPPFGAAEKQFLEIIGRETPILYDANYAHYCGFRSNAWFNTLYESSMILNTRLFHELRPTAADPDEFERYAEVVLRWHAYGWRKMRTPMETTCPVIASKLNRLDDVVGRMSYR